MRFFFTLKPNINTIQILYDIRLIDNSLQIMVFIHIYIFEWYFCELDYPLRPLQCFSSR